MSHISIRPLAHSDLLDIWSYFSQSSEEKANALLIEFNQKFQLLSETPQMGRARPELLRDLRSFPCDNYIIFYFSTPEGIEIVRVLHMRRDIEAIISEP
jgi:toxin ParE1/3/4